MKRLFFYSFLILVFLFACSKPFDPDELDDTQDAADSGENTASVTVYLDESGLGARAGASRAMNKAFAEMGCDYFEVVFVGNAGSGAVSVMGQWRIGERAVVKDVPRGVEYDSVNDAAPASGHGSAILLAGKSDKTLLALGALSYIDNTPIATSSLITTSTTKVTFSVASIVAGVKTDPASPLNSFLTAALDTATNYTSITTGNTEAFDEVIQNSYFTAFKFSTGKIIHAEYTFKLNVGDLTDYGLLVAKAGTVEKKYPSYTTPMGGNINTNSVILFDDKTVVAMTNNQTVGGAFNPAVHLTFNTAGTTGGSIFALVFEIPVYALRTDCRWYIRPGYGVLKYELDNGLGSMGGAVLIRTGDVFVPVPSISFKIRIKTVPKKWRYRWIGAPGEVNNPASPWYPGVSGALTGYNYSDEWDRTFRYDGLEVELLRTSNNTLIELGDPDAAYFPVNASGILDPASLSYTIGTNPPMQLYNGYDLADEFYGLIKVTVEYRHINDILSNAESFYILVSGHYTQTSGIDSPNNSTTTFDYAALTHMNTVGAVNSTACQVTVTQANGLPGGLRQALEGLKNNLRIILLNNTIEIDEPSLNVNKGEATLFMIMSIGNNMILGRGSKGGSNGNQIIIQGNRANLSAFYFGKWPFEGLWNSPFAVGATKEYSLNAGGRATSSFTRVFDNKMIIDGGSFGGNGGIYNVDIGPGVDVYYPLYLH